MENKRPHIRTDRAFLLVALITLLMRPAIDHPATAGSPVGRAVPHHRTTVVQRCPHCGRVVEPSWRFCEYCGYKLTRVTRQAPAPTASLTIEPASDAAGRNVDGVTVVVNGLSRDVVRGAVTLTVPPGRTAVLIEKAGYRPFSADVIVLRGRSGRVKPVLQAATGSLSVAQSGIAGDGVTITTSSGLAIGNPQASPFVVADLPEGQYSVRDEAPGYQAFGTTVEVGAGRTTIVQPVLQREGATLTVTVPSVSAGVWVDGFYKGQAGSKIATAAGPHVVKVKTDGATMTLQNVTAAPGQDTVLPLGLLDIMAIDGPGQVSLAGNGQPMTSYGMSPMKVPVSRGDWVVRLERAGQPPVEKRYTVVAGSVTPVDAEVPCATVQVMYDAPTEFATRTCDWYVDNALVLSGLTGQLRIAPGHHVIGFIAKGDGYNWHIADSTGRVQSSGTLGGRVAAEFDVDLPAGPAVVQAHSSVRQKGVPLLLMFSKDVAEIAVSVDDKKVKTRDW